MNLWLKVLLEEDKACILPRSHRGTAILAIGESLFVSLICHRICQNFKLSH